MNLNIQDLIAIWGPLGSLIAFMWFHFNKKFDKLEDKINEVDKRLSAQISEVDKRLSGQIMDIRDRLSRIEGQLTYTKIVPFEYEPHPKKKVKSE